jgi:hypothetical protein
MTEKAAKSVLDTLALIVQCRAENHPAMRLKSGFKPTLPDSNSCLATSMTVPAEDKTTLPGRHSGKKPPKPEADEFPTGL